MQPWLGGPRADLGLTEAQIRDTLSAAYGPTVRHEVILLDSSDQPTGVSAPVDMGHSGSQVRWSYRVPDRAGGAARQTAAVRRMAEVRLVGEVSFNVLSTRFLLRSSFKSRTGVWVPFDLGVFVATMPASDDDGVIVSHVLSLADKTHRYATRLLPSSLTIPSGTVGTSWVKADLIATFGETRLSIPHSAVTVPHNLVFDAGTSRLAVYNHVLHLIGYDDLIVDESGSPTARPLADLTNIGPEHTYQPGTTILPGGRLEAVLPSLPNVVRFVAANGPSLPADGNGWATRYNHSTGPASIDQRGDQIWHTVTVDAANQTELDAIADADCQHYFAGGGVRLSGRVALNPRHSDRDVNAVVRERLGLSSASDAWLVTEWTYPFRRIEQPGDVIMPITWERRVTATDAP